MKYTLTQLRGLFKRLTNNMPTCVIVQAGDSSERVDEVTGTTEQPRDTSISALNAWRKLFSKSSIVYVNLRSVYLAVNFSNGFALHAIGDDAAPRTEIKGVIKYNGTICQIMQPDTDELSFGSIEEVKLLLEKLEVMGSVAV